MKHVSFPFAFFSFLSKNTAHQRSTAHIMEKFMFCDKGMSFTSHFIHLRAAHIEVRHLRRHPMVRIGREERVILTAWARSLKRLLALNEGYHLRKREQSQHHSSFSSPSSKLLPPFHLFPSFPLSFSISEKHTFSHASAPTPCSLTCEISDADTRTERVYVPGDRVENRTK